MQPGVSIAAVALRYRLNANLLRRWLAAHEEQIAAPALSRAAIPAAEFVALPLCNAKSNEESQDIVVELRRGATTVTLRWPVSAAGECAQWLQGWLR
jgi:transposase